METYLKSTDSAVTCLEVVAILGQFLLNVGATHARQDTIQHVCSRRVNMAYLVFLLQCKCRQLNVTLSRVFDGIASLVYTVLYAGEPQQDGSSLDLMGLFGNWTQDQGEVLSADDISSISKCLREASVLSHEAQSQEELVAEMNEHFATLRAKIGRQVKAAKWEIPSHHGMKLYPGAMWHELPAANGLFLKRTRGYPLKSYALPEGGHKLTGDSGNYSCTIFGGRLGLLTRAHL